MEATFEASRRSPLRKSSSRQNTLHSRHLGVRADTSCETADRFAASFALTPTFTSSVYVMFPYVFSRHFQVCNAMLGNHGNLRHGNGACIDTENGACSALPGALGVRRLQKKTGASVAASILTRVVE